MTTGSFNNMYSEDYSTPNGPSTIQIEDGKAKWTFNYGGVEHHGEVDVEASGGQEPALFQARKDVTAFASSVHTLPLTPVQEVQPAAEPDTQPAPDPDKGLETDPSSTDNV
jgi:hypothetical protein